MSIETGKNIHTGKNNINLKYEYITLDYYKKSCQIISMRTF